MHRLKLSIYFIASLWRFWTALTLVDGATLLVYLYAPPQHNPWRPLNLSDPPGFTTHRKLAKLARDPNMCLSALDAVSIPYIPLVDEQTGPDCGFTNALTANRLATPYSDELRLTCPLAAHLYIWETQAARPLARELLGAELVSIETYGTYACRNIARTRRRSEHATANAIDIAGFRLSDGRLITVKQSWATDTPEGEYLKRLHKMSCRLFSVTLGPDYNADHSDHFHMDNGKSRTCR